MRNGILILAAAVVMVFTSCKDNAADKVQAENVEAAASRDASANKFPAMTFAESAFDFGTIKEGDVVEHTFIFTNTGDAPLVITDTKTSCGCTVPSYPKGESIAPGEKGKLVVQFDSRGKKNMQNKSIQITANTKKGTELIRIKANVIPKEATSGTPIQK